MTGKGDTLNIVDLMETYPKCKFAVYPENMDRIPKVSFERRVVNAIARAMHKVIRKKLELEGDIDPETGQYLEQPDYVLPNYESTERVNLNIIGDQFFDLPCHDIPEESNSNKKYLSTTRTSIFLTQILTMFERIDLN